MPLAREIVTVAVPPASATEAVMPLVAVISELPLESSTVVPSISRLSVAPVPATLVTVMMIWSRVWPASTVETDGLENRSTAAPFSVKPGLAPVAVSVGSSLRGATWIVAVPALLSTKPSLTV